MSHEGIVVPFNEYGQTSAGRVKVLPGALTVPTSGVPIRDRHREHGAPAPVTVGRTTAIEIRDGGLWVAADVEGDYSGPVSIETSHTHIHRDEVTAARLTAVVFTDEPAFAGTSLDPVETATPPADTDETE